jgi:hypothetical protein
MDDQEQAQLMLVRWKKGINMFSSFFAELTEVRRRVGDERFAGWCAEHLNLGLSVLTRVSDILKDADAAKAKDELRRAAELERLRKKQEREARKQAREAAKAERVAKPKPAPKPRKPKAEKPKVVVTDGTNVTPLRGDLDALTKRAKKTAEIVDDLFQISVAAKRAYVVQYGAALLAIRKLIPGDGAFGQHLKANGLDICTMQFRYAAMWLAEHWDQVSPQLDKCPHAHPETIRVWLRKHGSPLMHERVAAAE